MHDFYERWPKHLHTINCKNQSNEQVYTLFSSNLKMLCNLCNCFAKLVYLCNMYLNIVFQFAENPFRFVLQNWTISLHLEKDILLHITNV